MPTTSAGGKRSSKPRPAFHARGYETGSLDDVAAEMDLRKASLYYYVDSKAQLLYWVFDRAISLALERLDELSEIADPAERLAAFVAHQVSVVAEERSLLTVFFESRLRLDTVYEEAIRQKERRYIKLYIDAVSNAVKAGVIPEINPRYGAHAILGMTSWVYKWFDPVEANWADVAGDFIQLILRAPVPVGTRSPQPTLSGHTEDCGQVRRVLIAVRGSCNLPAHLLHTSSAAQIGCLRRACDGSASS